MSIVKPIGDADFLKKKIPVSNAQRKLYKDVTPQVDTGVTLKKSLAGKDAGSTHAAIAVQEGIYSRMSASEFLLFVLHADEVYAEKYNKPPYIIVDVRPTIREHSEARASTGARDASQSPAPSRVEVNDERITDVNTLHGAVEYHLRQLNHSTTPFPSSIYNIIRKPNGFVLLFDDCEDVLDGPINGAVRFSEKGVNNIVVLSKGFENLKVKFGDVLDLWTTNGPEDALTLLRLKIKQRETERGRGNSQSGTSKVGSSTVQSLQLSNSGTMRKTKGLSSSLARTHCSMSSSRGNPSDECTTLPAWK